MGSGLQIGMVLECCGGVCFLDILFCVARVAGFQLEVAGVLSWRVLLGGKASGWRGLLS